MRRALLERTEGITVRLVRLIETLAVDAIRNHTEKMKRLMSRCTKIPDKLFFIFKDFPVFSCNVTARKYRNFVLKSRTNFELKFVRDFRDLSTRHGKRPPSLQPIRSLPYPMPFLCFHCLIHTRISTFFLILSGAQSGIQVHDAFPKSGIYLQ